MMHSFTRIHCGHFLRVVFFCFHSNSEGFIQVILWQIERLLRRFYCLLRRNGELEGKVVVLVVYGQPADFMMGGAYNHGLRL